MELCYQDPVAGGYTFTREDALDMEWDEFRFYLHRVRRLRERLRSRMRGS